MSATEPGGRLKMFLLVLLYLVAIGFAAFESRVTGMTAAQTRSGT